MKTELEQFVAPKEETQTEEITKEFKDGERETLPLVRMAYDTWICPVKDVYYETFCESTVKGQKLYVACLPAQREMRFLPFQTALSKSVIMRSRMVITWSWQRKMARRSDTGI